jgi:hypothetical protein
MGVGRDRARIGRHGAIVGEDREGGYGSEEQAMDVTRERELRCCCVSFHSYVRTFIHSFVRSIVRVGGLTRRFVVRAGCVGRYIYTLTGVG